MLSYIISIVNIHALVEFVVHGKGDPLDPANFLDLFVVSKGD